MSTNFPILKIFKNMDKNKHENVIKFNIGNELAVQLFSKGEIKFKDITNIIEKSILIDFNFKLNNIKNILLYQNEFFKKMQSNINVKK